MRECARETSPVSARARCDAGFLPVDGDPPRTCGRGSQGSGPGRSRPLLLESATEPLPPRQTSGAVEGARPRVLSDPVEELTRMADVSGDWNCRACCCSCARLLAASSLLEVLLTEGHASCASRCSMHAFMRKFSARSCAIVSRCVRIVSRALLRLASLSSAATISSLPDIPSLSVPGSSLLSCCTAAQSCSMRLCRESDGRSCASKAHCAGVSRDSSPTAHTRLTRWSATFAAPSLVICTMLLSLLVVRVARAQAKFGYFGSPPGFLGGVAGGLRRVNRRCCKTSPEEKQLQQQTPEKKSFGGSKVKGAGFGHLRGAGEIADHGRRAGAAIPL